VVPTSEFSLMGRPIAGCCGKRLINYALAENAIYRPIKQSQYFATEIFSESAIFATVPKCPLLLFQVLFLCIGLFGVATIDCRSDDDDISESERLIHCDVA
jgi:hypothetical protein